MAADPAIIYWNPATLAAIAPRARAARRAAASAFFTIDAGPHVKVLCARRRRRRRRRPRSRAIPGRAATVRSPRPGPGARVVEAPVDDGRRCEGDRRSRAPGKLFLLGEYAVLDGCHRGRRRRRSPRGRPVRRRAARRRRRWSTRRSSAVRGYLVEDGGSRCPPARRCSTAVALASTAGKLGLGSSAAVAAAASGPCWRRPAATSRHASLAFTLAEPRAPRRAGRARLGRRRRRRGLRRRARVHAPEAGVAVHTARPAARHVEVVVFSTGTPSSTVDRLRAARDARPTAIRAARQRRYAALGAIAGALRAWALRERGRARRRRRGRAREPAAGGARRRRSACRSSPPPSPRRPRSPRSWAARPSRRARAAATSASPSCPITRPPQTFRERAPHLGLDNP